MEIEKLKETAQAATPRVDSKIADGMRITKISRGNEIEPSFVSAYLSKDRYFVEADLDGDTWIVATFNNPKDAALFIESRGAILALVDEVERLREDNETLASNNKWFKEQLRVKNGLCARDGCEGRLMDGGAIFCAKHYKEWADEMGIT